MATNETLLKNSTLILTVNAEVFLLLAFPQKFYTFLTWNKTVNNSVYGFFNTLEFTFF